MFGKYALFTLTFVFLVASAARVTPLQSSPNSADQVRASLMGSSAVENATSLDIADYMPMHVNDVWMYNEPTDHGDIIDRIFSIGNNTTFHGYTVSPLICSQQYSIHSQPDLWTDYMVLNTNGYLQYGMWDPDETTPAPDDGVESFYDPPIRWLPRNIVVGETYTFSIGDITLYAYIASRGSVTVSAGTFNDVIKVVTTFTGSGAPYARTCWYALGVGKIKNYGYYHSGTPMNYEMRYAKINGQVYGNATLPAPLSLKLTIDPGVSYTAPLNGIALSYALTGISTYTGALVLDAGGKATISGIIPGIYNLSIFGSHWLRRVIPDVTVDGVNVVNTSLTNGDADGGNSINLFDFVVLDSKFGSSHRMADLNGDGAVNLFDYVVIDQHFGAIGD